MTEEITVPDQFLTGPSVFPWWLLLVWGILTLLIGCMFLITPGMTTVLLITFMGAYWLVGGIFAISSLVVDRSHMGWKIFLAVINILAGILILLYPWFSTIFVLSFFVIFIGFWAIFIGVSHLYHGWIMKDAGNAVLGIISMIFGLLLLINPFIVAALLPYVAGGFAVVFGLASIYVSFVAKKYQETPGPCNP
ncbi:HdeD family acid-resistance protein [Methanoregula sp.]|uniref:HdeD family acid-resistance protein n=1 Tax=Methanoregula sp. TaxID=2052170 RepID=UPI003C709D84